MDAMCSSGISALHLGKLSLRSMEADAALIGAVNLIPNSRTTLALHNAGILSINGQVTPWSDSATGYVRGEAAAFLLLKPLCMCTTTELKSHVYATILGSAVSQSGERRGYSFPSRSAMAANMTRALEDARYALSIWILGSRGCSAV